MNKLISGLLLSGALLIGAVLPTVANADTTTPAAENRTGNTTVIAGFTANTDGVKPVDPSNPGTGDGTGGDGGNGVDVPNGGGLSLIYVTNNLNFGTHEIDVLKSNDYYAHDTTGNSTSALWNDKAVIEVSDVRGTKAGWSLGVTGSELTGKDADGKALAAIDGAELTLPAGAVSSADSIDGNGSVATATTNVLGSTATVLTAAKGSGSGVTIDQLDPSAIKLTIPANSAEAGTYTATLNWNLASLPTE